MPFKSLLTKKLSLFQLLIISIGIGLITYFSVRYQFEENISNDVPTAMNTKSKLTIIRAKDYKYTRPLYAFDMDEESENLISIKDTLNQYILQNKEAGSLFDASVYLRNMETGEYITINNNMQYHPGSLIKVPMLIYYLKEAESNPNILDQKLNLSGNGREIRQTYNNKQIEYNKPYSIRDLLKYMAAYSDNRATMLLNMHCQIPKFKKVFSDLGLPEPDITDTNYAMTVREYSVFMRVLYNATYLNAEHSDYALELLTESSFQDGIVNKLPGNVSVAHKFGEMVKDQKRELHESGIIYCDNQPYMLIVMTKGYNVQQLANFISTISDAIFRFYCH